MLIDEIKCKHIYKYYIQWYYCIIIIIIYLGTVVGDMRSYIGILIYDIYYILLNNKTLLNNK